MSSCSRAVYSKRRTHNYGGVRRIGQKRSVTGIRHNIGPANFHGHTDIDVAEVALKHLLTFMHWVAMPTYAENQFARYSIVKCQLLNEPLHFDGGIDIVAAFWEDGYDKCWHSLCIPLNSSHATLSCCDKG
jgi:hypothetical protein